MTDFDLDRLGELWRQDPEPAEIERMRQSAAAISRRARRAQLADNLGAASLTLSDGEITKLSAISAPHVGEYPYGAGGTNQRFRKLAGGR